MKFADERGSDKKITKKKSFPEIIANHIIYILKCQLVKDGDYF